MDVMDASTPGTNYTTELIGSTKSRMELLSSTRKSTKGSSIDVSCGTGFDKAAGHSRTT